MGNCINSNGPWTASARRTIPPSGRTVPAREEGELRLKGDPPKYPAGVLIPNQESRFAGGFNLRSTVRICLWCGHHALQRLHLNSLFGAELLLLTPLHRNFPQKGVPRIGMRRASTPARNRVNQAMFPTMIRPKSRAVPAKRIFLFWIGICVAGFLPALRAQTFEIGNQPAQSSPNAPAHKGKAKSSSPPSSSSEGIGWGNSIELGRVARAAEQALHKGNYAAATESAQ